VIGFVFFQARGFKKKFCLFFGLFLVKTRRQQKARLYVKKENTITTTPANAGRNHSMLS